MTMLPDQGGSSQETIRRALALLEENDGERRAARLLFEAGVKKAWIARFLGVQWDTVDRWVTPEVAERARSRNRENMRRKRASSAASDETERS